jgi:hypothetical protein
MIDRLLNLSHSKSCEILSAGCAFFPDASIDEQLGMIALPVGDRSVGNERAGFRSARAFEPIVGYLMSPAKSDQASDAQLSVQFLGCSALAKCITEPTEPPKQIAQYCSAATVSRRMRQNISISFPRPCPVRCRAQNRVDILRLNAGPRLIETVSVNREEFAAITT